MTNANDVTDMAATEGYMEKVLDQVRVQQEHYKKLRGRAALAHMVASGFSLIDYILTSIDEDVQVSVLDQYQLTKRDGVNRFTPWINCIWGEADEKADHIVCLSGEKYPKWEPNKSMSVYFHTMEALSEAGFNSETRIDTMVEWILDQGGSQAVANKRKKALSDNPDPEIEKAAQTRRTLYCDFGPSTPIDLDTGIIKLPEGLGNFFGLLVERCADGSLLARGITEINAISRLNKLAADNEQTLLGLQQAAVLKAKHFAEFEAARKAEKPTVGGGEVSGSAAIIKKVMAKQKAKAAATAAG